MRPTTSRRVRARLRVGLLAGVTLLVLTTGEAPVLGSGGAVAEVSGPRHTAHTADVSNAWHTARISSRTSSTRSAEWRAAVSRSPHLSRAQVDAMTPRQVVDATLGNVVGHRGPGHAGVVGRRGGKTVFGLTTFNALGSQHTAPGGDAVSYAPGRIRTQWMADYLSTLDSTIVGMQEIQADQVSNLNLTTGGRYSFWPGSSLGYAGIPQTMMWQTSLWKPKTLDYIVVPFMGGTRPQPVVLLKNRKTKQKIWILNIHNSPKDAKGRQGERNRATAIERRAVRKLGSQGHPVFILGDFNDHARAFCAMTRMSGLKAANGGSHPRQGRCRPPRTMRVDWIFGSRSAMMANYRMDEGPIVQRITDHAVVTTTVTVH